MRTPGALATFVIALVCLQACESGSPIPPGSPDPVSSASTPAVVASEAVRSRCPDLERALSDGEPIGGSPSADVDGDGEDDLVRLVLHEEARPGCRRLLVVDTGAGLLATPTDDVDREYSLPVPRINALASVDDEPGAEILVDLEQGASTQFVGMFTVTDGSLERVRVRDGGIDDLFPYGGSVGHIEASDCGEEPGTVVVSVATPLRDRYEVERTVYRFQDAELIPDKDASETVMLVSQRLLRLPEFRSSPFGSCPQPGGGA